MSDVMPNLSILSDQPADEDQLNFGPYAKTLADILADPNTDTPLTIGVFGGWGQGKTSLMRMVQRRLQATEGTSFPVQSVWFNAWLYHHQPSLWRALISRVLSGVLGFPALDAGARAGLRQLEARLYGVAAAGAGAGSGGHLTLPPIAPEAVSEYVRQVAREALPDARCQEVFVAGLEANPHRIKRTLNIFTLLWRLAQNREDLREVIRAVRLAKVVVIQQYHPRLFALIAQEPHYLIDLERRFREQEHQERGAGKGGRGAAEGMPGALQETTDGEGAARREGDGASAGPLSEFLGRGLLRALLTCTAEDEADANFVDLTPAGVREYVYLTRSAVEAAPQAQQAALPFEPQMVTIPAGPFLMGTPKGEVDELHRLLQQENKDAERERMRSNT